jgi:hypothetical protein
MARSENLAKEKRNNPMELTLQNPALVAGNTTFKAITIAYWVVTAVFCLEMSFTAYYELLVLPQAAEAFTRLGFPPAFSGWNSHGPRWRGCSPCSSP